nr:hypothetical protein [Tanacetum cinerariifolium]
MNMPYVQNQMHFQAQDFLTLLNYKRLEFIRAIVEQLKLYDERSKQLREVRKNTLDLLDSSERTMAQL